MNNCSLYLFLCLASTTVVQAEYRTIAIEVARSQANRVSVTIHSDVKAEKQTGVTVQAAAAIVKDAKGWGSSVGVAIISDGADLSSYLPILEAVAKNPWLDLELMRTKRTRMGDQILRHYKIDTEAKSEGRLDASQ